MKTLRLTSIAILIVLLLSSNIFACELSDLNKDYVEFPYPSMPHIVTEKNHIEGKTIRVGWFSSDGVHQLDHKGSLAGFDYEYLQAIAQYNNWSYEYHFGSFAECYEWLKNGQIDIMGIINKTDERLEFLDFSRTNAGIELCSLFTNNNNTEYEYEDFHNFNNMVIGIEEGTVQGSMLEAYAKQNHFNYIPKFYPTLNEGKIGLKNGEIDALLASNTDVIKGFKSIAQFSPIPFYFATTKGNTQVMNGVNYAMDRILGYNPNFNNHLYAKYFSKPVSDKIVFSAKEMEYINKKPEIEVLIDPIWYPMESYNNITKQYEGIIPDIMNQISKRSGLKFEFVTLDSSIAALNDIASANSYNKITSISFDYKWANENNVKITQPFISTSIQMVRKYPKSAETVALVRKDYITNMVKELYPELKVKYYESAAESIAAVKSGKVDSTFINNFEAEYYMSLEDYSGLYFSTVNTFKQDICLGLSNNSDPMLFSIISKCIQDIPSATIQDIMLKNVYVSHEVTLMEFTKSHTLGVSVFTFSILIFMLVWMYTSLKSKNASANAIALEIKKFNQLTELSNEHIFEYDYKTDTLTFKNNSNPLLCEFNPCLNYSKYVEKKSKGNKEEFNNSLYSCLVNQTDLIKDINYEYTNGIKNWLRITTKIIKNDLDVPAYAIGKLQNVQTEHEEIEYLIKQATIDGLTHILNAKSFKENVKENLKNGSALLLVDLDHFKFINDRYGHLSGDLVLVEVAKLLTNTFSKVGFPGRIGGDEFAVFIPNEIPFNLLEDLCRQTVENASEIKFKYNGTAVSPVTISIGASVLEDDISFEEFFENTDKMLYKAKENGRNSYQIKAIKS